MNTTKEFLKLLYELDIKIMIKDDDLFINAPKSRLTPELHKELKERKSEIYNYLETTSSISSASLKPIPRVSRTNKIPLSFAQERLWFLDQLFPNSPFYNISRALHLKGHIDFHALHSTLDAIIQRHEPLRTRFHIYKNEPVQIIEEDRSVLLSIIDLTSLINNDKQSESQRNALDESLVPFNIEKDLMIRTKLMRMSEEEYVLLLTMHHIASDGWSMRIFRKEIVELYRSCLKGEQSLLSELPIQYADYAVWQREWLSGKVLNKQLSYWVNQLSDLTPVNLPTDYRRPSIQSFHGARLSSFIEPDVTKKLKKVSQVNEASLYMTLLAAFTILLSRYSGQEDIAIGSPIANRNRKEIENLIGFFVNTLIMRMNISGNPSFIELINRVKKTALGAYENQDIPFELLIEEIQPERDMSRNPLFDIIFALQNNPESPFEIPELTVKPMESMNQTVRFDMEVHLSEVFEGLTVNVVYSTDLFESDTISRFIKHFIDLLEKLADNPSKLLSEISILSEEEAHTVLNEWNDTDTDYHLDKNVHQLFEDQVEQTPDTVGLEFGDNNISYRHLNLRANQLAHVLKSKGVGRGSTIGIMVERSSETISTVLGVMKAGAVCLPIDPEYPEERILFMLEDSGVQILLTQEAISDIALKTLQDRSGKRHGNKRIEILLIDEMMEKLEGKVNSNLNHITAPADLVYILYTSGSTGTPKGVELPHHALSNLIQWHWEDYGRQCRRARTLQYSSLSFDASFHEIFSTLCSGGTLIIISEEMKLNFSELIEMSRYRNIERLFLPFVALRMLADVITNSDGISKSMRQIISTAEQLQITPSISTLFKNHDICTLHNHYGPSESHVVTSLTLNDMEDWRFLPTIGKPISNTRIYLLDSHGQPIPIGCPGELHIGGVCLARGYLNRPDVSAEKFIPNMYDINPGSRVYRTGDLARYLKDGDIDYIGRIDHQIKIRGFRVELGEIESVLSNHADVKENIIIANEVQPGDMRLVAYIVPFKYQGLDAAEVRHFLKDRLPDYMIPSAFVILEKLPLTPNGKVDRKKLPIPDKSGLEKIYVKPRNEIERKLTEIWMLVLKNKKVGIYDNFFEIGGHSLLATQVISRIRESFMLELPVRTMFEAQSIEEMSIKIERFMYVISSENIDNTNSDRKAAKIII